MDFKNLINVFVHINLEVLKIILNGSNLFLLVVFSIVFKAVFRIY